MIQIELDLGGLEAWPTDKLGSFNADLVRHLPGLQKHSCSYGEEGGFTRRMQEGTWLGHVVEHVALEIQTAVGCKVTRGKTRSKKGRPGVYYVMYAYTDDRIGLQAGRMALELVDSLLPATLRGIAGLELVAEAIDERDFALD